jgi:hypothetical protein
MVHAVPHVAVIFRRSAVYIAPMADVQDKHNLLLVVYFVD